MAYDEALADRIRDLLADVPDLTEKKMFGGLAFLVGGHMAVTASGRGGLMVRCAPEDTAAHLAAGATPFEMRGKPMDGWLRVPAESVADDASLARWFLRVDGRRPHFDLWRANLDQLETAGVNPHFVHLSGLCTRTYPEAFHSYRAAGQQAGRMAAVIRANPMV